MSIDNPRRRFVAHCGVFAAAAMTPALLRAAAPTAASTWPGYRQAMVIDACGAPGRSEMGERHPLDSGELSEIAASGVTAINLTVSGVGRYASDFETTMSNIAYWDHQIAEHADLLLKFAHPADLDLAKRSHRLAVIYGFQDATPFGENLDRLDMFYQAGVRIIQPTYNRRNLMGDGCLEAGNAGLSQLGQELIAQLNQRGMLLDLSHCGQRTTREGIEFSKQPVAITHTGCTAVTDLPRNKRDEELRALAQRGGVMGIYLMPYLRDVGQPMAEDVVRHLEHAVNVCGEEHVGIGTDGGIPAVNLDANYKEQLQEEIAERKKRGISAPGERADSYTFVPDLNTPRRMEKLALLLSQRGHADARIEKVLGGNFARLFREVMR